MEPERHEPHWVRDAAFVHVYPLGAVGAPDTNDGQGPVETRLDALLAWVDVWADLGATGVYLGPVFESSSHGYDTADYFHVDRRLGGDEALKRLVDAFHARGMKVLFDGVFHHVGRRFWAFRDLQQHGEASAYRGWFAGLRFDRQNRFGDRFAYDSWSGVDTLVKLNLHEPPVRQHLFDAVRHWRERFGIDGLRLDAADAIDLGFFDALSAFCASLAPDFWLLGEVIHGDYRTWARPGRLHATTDYALFKALWSSHNDKNYFELAHTLDREHASAGMYKGLALYTFADNHDVDRLASTLKDPAHLPLVYLLLATLPGVPSFYAGSEWGATGRKVGGNDAPLRPPLPPPPFPIEAPHRSLRDDLRRFLALRRSQLALRRGTYQSLLVKNEQLAFLREANGERIVVVVNLAHAPSRVDVPVPGEGDGPWRDLLNPGEASAAAGALRVDVAPTSFRVLRGGVAGGNAPLV